MSGANVDNVFDRVDTKVKGLLDENAQLREQNRVLARLLAKAQPHVCSALCPSVKRDGDLWTHKDLCAHMEAALTATSQPVPPYKEWCRHPEKCAGLASCPQDPTCAD
jgi:hypothetical protein